MKVTSAVEGWKSHSCDTISFNIHINGIQWSRVQIPLRWLGQIPLRSWVQITLHSCDYLKKISIKINVATDEGKAEMKSDTEQNDEIGVAVQSWLWVRIELMAW